MNRIALSLYHRLPPPVASVAASVWGIRLRALRYGTGPEHMVARALARDKWTREEWEAWQRESLRKSLERSFRTVPFYRRWWQERGVDSGGEAPPLEAWPVLSKGDVRRGGRAFVPGDLARQGLLAEHTSGSTGTPLTVWWGRSTIREWYALFEARTRAWCGVSWREPWAILGGQLVVPSRRRRPPFWVWNAPLRQLYMSVFHLSAETAAAYARAIEERGVTHLLGYPSALNALASGLLDRKRTVRGVRAVIVNAEPLSEAQRRAISTVFSAPVRETYGMAELVAAASECEHGRLHLWPEVGVVEVLDDSCNPVAPGEAGRLVCTGLLNPAMPLVRYDTGDRGLRASREDACPCGRGLPLIGPVEGRQDDVVITPDGRAVGRLDGAFKADLPIREAQIVQEEVDLVRVRLVAADGFDEAAERDLEGRLRGRLGHRIRLEFERVDRLERGPGGKLRGVVSRIGGGRGARGSAGV